MFTRRRIWILLGCCLLAAGALLVLLYPSDNEPNYQGRKLSEWVISYERKGEAERFPPYLKGQTRKAQEAVSAIGTNAIPTLLQWMQYTPPARTVRNWLISTAGQWLHGDWSLEDSQWDRAQGAMRAVIQLGHETQVPMAPLSKMLLATNGSGFRAAIVLARLGKASPFMTALTNENPIVRARAAYYAADLGSNATPVVPLLINAMRDPEHRVAENAAFTLTQLKLQTSAVVAALIDILKQSEAKSDEGRLKTAIETLRDFGTTSRPAVPTLVALLNSTNTKYQLRKEVRNALDYIAPDLLTNAVPQ